MTRRRAHKSGIIRRKMTPPDSNQHNPDPNYCAALVAQSGLTQEAIAERLKISKRALRCYKDPGPSGLPMPYLVQYALECLPKTKPQN